VENKTRIMWIP